MLTDVNLRSQVDALWDKLWSGGLSNPLDAIEQFSYLLFMKRLDDEENQKEAAARRRGQPYTPRLEDEIRWRTWTQMEGASMLEHVRTTVFPKLKTMGVQGSSFERYMQGAEFKISKPTLLVEACKVIDQMQIAAQNQDVQGDLYEYMLRQLASSGRNGQFRTPRHIIRMMIQMVDPKPGERIGDLAAGTAGFLVNAYQHILAQHTPPENLKFDEEGEVHGADGSLLNDQQRSFLQTRAFRGYDNDSGMTMLRIGSMNLMLHGLQNPQFFYRDTLSKGYDEPNEYDVILMNPPFKGAIDKEDVSTHLPSSTTKSELLFVHQILRVLDSGGRCAVIVPDGVLFGTSRAHIELRRKLVEEHGLIGVVSMPSGVFKPYAGVSTAVLLFVKGGSTDTVWFYEMERDGYTLDDKRIPTPNENDIPDLLESWRRRNDSAYDAQRTARLTELRAQIEPLQARRLELERDLHRLQYEAALSAPNDAAQRAALLQEQRQLTELHRQIEPLKAERDALTRQFWVTKAQMKANKYDLSSARYRLIEQDQVFYEDPSVTIDRILTLEQMVSDTIRRIGEQLKN